MKRANWACRLDDGDVKEAVRVDDDVMTTRRKT
jgi:hypothetical protein